MLLFTYWREPDCCAVISISLVLSMVYQYTESWRLNYKKFSPLVRATGLWPWTLCFRCDHCRILSSCTCCCTKLSRKSGLSNKNWVTVSGWRSTTKNKKNITLYNNNKKIYHNKKIKISYNKNKKCRTLYKKKIRVS